MRTARTASFDNDRQGADVKSDNADYLPCGQRRRPAASTIARPSPCSSGKGNYRQETNLRGIGTFAGHSEVIVSVGSDVFCCSCHLHQRQCIQVSAVYVLQQYAEVSVVVSLWTGIHSD